MISNLAICLIGQKMKLQAEITHDGGIYLKPLFSTVYLIKTGRRVDT